MPAAATSMRSIPPIDEWPLSRTRRGAATSRHVRRSVVPLQSVPSAGNRQRIDRIQLSMWAFLRSATGLGCPVPPSLATGGMLGGSQAGARLLYNFTRQIAAVLRDQFRRRPARRRSRLGIRVHPLQSVPVWLTAERRQRIGNTGGGRNAFAVFAEGGRLRAPLCRRLRARRLCPGRRRRRPQARPVRRWRRDGHAPALQKILRRVRRLGRRAAGRCIGSMSARA